MTHKSIWRWIALVCVLAAACILTVRVHDTRQQMCLGVPVLTEEEFAPLEERLGSSYIYEILYNGEPAPMDEWEDVIYISQPIGEDTAHPDFSGTLECTNPKVSLCFAPDRSFENMDWAVSRNHEFKLLAVHEDKEGIFVFKVVFTPLPVVCLSGEEKRDAANVPYNGGVMRFWDPGEGEARPHSLITSDLTWKVRGATSASMSKKPWKLSLKDARGEPDNVDLLGLGSDDDWILNPMNLDDLMIRESVGMDLWAAMQATSADPIPMSRGEYVEVIINGKYRGLYFLQRRVDGRLLGMEGNDVLIKGRGVWEASRPAQAFEVVERPEGMTDTQALQMTTDLYENYDPAHIDLDQWIDTELFLQLGYLVDNRGYKNMFYFFDDLGDTYRIRFVPWDTDMSFGLGWTDFFAHQPESYNWKNHRFEYEALKKYDPELKKKLAARWFELRETLWTEENLRNMFKDTYGFLEDTGALGRDKDKWGLFYKGSDTMDELVFYLHRRLEYLDDYYGDA